MKSDTIQVFHFQEGSSDKVWAINTVVRADAHYSVWYGRRNATLVHDTVPAVGSGQHSAKRIKSKVNKGYKFRPGLTVDTDSQKIVHRSVPQDEPEPEDIQKPESWWMTVGANVDARLIDDYLSESINKLVELDAEEAEYLQDTKTFKALSNHDRQAEIGFAEGPVALLLIHGLRRCIPSGGSGEILIADDNGNMVPDDFERLRPAIVAANGEYLKTGNGGRDHYSSVKAIRQYGIALGCTDAPVNLSVITTDTAAAFF